MAIFLFVCFLVMNTLGFIFRRLFMFIGWEGMPFVKDYILIDAMTIPLCNELL
jgi:hypothetical protein